jgi:hypothetical protein
MIHSDVSLRAAAIAVGAILLAGCGDMLVSKTPLFSASAAADAPRLRPGVWKPTGPLCDDPTHKESCSQEIGVSDTTLVFPPDAFSGSASMPYVVARGDPTILQMRLLSTNPMPQDAYAFTYVGLRPTQLDDRGRIVAFTIWGVACGEPIGPARPDGSRTIRPFRGLTVLQGHAGDCTTRSISAARSAARASDAMFPRDGRVSYEWVRDGAR